ncbi:thymidine kinase [Aeromonas phage AS-szw]|uniref:Thymidine kinase n=1 Tax=Aeromonas phage AS-szw TaxID=2026114 RepID=A0A291LDA6_9CAUD|nr:thymidine kinase [Aeromonas phage AS-szw]
MSSLHFHHSAMNAGKSSHLLQVAYNYEERGMGVLVLKPCIDTRDGEMVSSRLGVSRPSIMFSNKENLTDLYLSYKIGKKIDCILIDEAQFMTVEQVKQLAFIVDNYDVPVMCYGLMSDSNGEMFDASRQLVVMAEQIVEHKTICWCGSKATMNLRVDENGKKVIGDQVCIGGNDRYISVCRKHWVAGMSGK